VPRVRRHSSGSWDDKMKQIGLLSLFLLSAVTVTGHAVALMTNTPDQNRNGVRGEESNGIYDASLAEQDVVYANLITVDDDGPADFNSIQAAIDYATDGDVVEVRPGVYSENINFRGKSITVRAATFGSGPKSQYAFLAGFVSSWLVDANDPGFAGQFDLVVDGIADFLDFAVFAARWGSRGETVIDGDGNDVVTCNSGEDATSVLTGFTIAGGRWGLYCSSSSPTISNCVIISNSDDGVSCTSASPEVTNCTIVDNYDNGISCRSSSPRIINCTLSHNADYGLYCGLSSSPSISGCTISNNGGKGLYCESSSSPSVIACTITDNSDDGIFCSSSSPTITDCIITNNSWRGVNCSSSFPVITGCTMSHNRDGLYCSSSSPTVTNCIITNNSWSGVDCSSSFPVITGCTMSHNRDGLYCWSSSPTVSDCVIMSNSRYGLYCNYSSPAVTNCLIAKSSGYGVHCVSSSPSIVNCNIISNNGRGISESSGKTANCILWYNGDDLYGCSATYSCIEDGDSGVGNIACFPYFVDMANDEYHLLSYSACIDAGDPNSDFSSEPNGGGGRINIGAYGNTPEAQLASPDVDTDGLPDDWELLYWPDDPSLAQAAIQDPDHDGLSIIVEYQLGWNPAVENGLVLNTSTGLHYPDIHFAISFAAHGDTLVVYPGMYLGNIDFNGKAITLRSVDPADATIVADTIIYGAGQTGVVFASGEDSNSALIGFTITGGKNGIYCSGSSPRISNCEIRNNSDAGFYCNSSPSITNCTISNNAKDGLHCELSSSPSVKDCTITNNSLNGIYCGSSSSAAITDCIIANNSWNGVQCLSSSPIVTGCTISHNQSGLYCSLSSPTVSNCTMSGNSWYGVQCINSSPVVTNCVIAENSSYGVDCSDSSPSIFNCNILSNNGRGISESLGKITNCILGYNGDDLYNCSATYSCIQDGDSGSGNIAFYPYFVDISNDDSHLLSYSPCIDAGDPNSDYSKEINGGGGRINIGAYGNTPEATLASPDVDSDGLPDDWELLYWPDDPGLSQAALDDPDGDSLKNIVEYQMGSDPQMGQSISGPILNRRTGLAYPSIAKAIACAMEGDEIVVGPGTYDENINFSGRGVHVRSTDPNDPNIVASTVVSGNGESVVVFNSRESVNTIVDGLTITNGYSGIICSLSSSPAVMNCIVSNNSYYGLVCQSSSSPTVSNSTIVNNSNGGLYCDRSHPKVTNCTMSNNSGHGLHAYHSPLRVTNCIIAGNTSYGVCCSSSSPEIVNCTVINNRSYGIYYSSGETINCILWNNGDDLHNSKATFSCIEDDDAGIGNLSVNPRFVDPNNGDYHLAADSLCIDAGAPWSDYSREPMPNGNRVNLGAYGNTLEATVTTDVDGDGISDAWQRHYWPDYDPNFPNPDCGPNGNPDGDSFSNWSEYVSGYDPTEITAESIQIPYTNFTPFEFDPSEDETLTIDYMLNMDAQVTIGIHTLDISPDAYYWQTFSVAKALITTPLKNEPKRAGFNSLVWDGTDDMGEPLPLGAYVFTIEAVNGAGGKAVYDPDYTAGTVTLQNMTVGSSFDPYKNESCEIRYDLSAPAWLDLQIFVGNTPVRKLVHWEPRPTTGNIELWDGRNDSNNVVGTASFSVRGFGQILPENAFVVESEALAITSLSAEAYLIVPSYNQISTIYYTITQNAKVTIKIYAPDTGYFRTLFDTAAYESAGSYAIEWEGTDDSGKLASVEGDYRVEVTVEGVSGERITRNANIIVYR